MVLNYQESSFVRLRTGGEYVKEPHFCVDSRFEEITVEELEISIEKATFEQLAKKAKEMNTQFENNEDDNEIKEIISEVALDLIQEGGKNE